MDTILKEQISETETLVRNSREKIDKLVVSLLERNKLTREEMEALLDG